MTFFILRKEKYDPNKNKKKSFVHFYGEGNLND